MPLIALLAVVALVVGSTALGMAISDFKTRTTFRGATGVSIYLGWSCHAAAFMAAIVRDPYRIATVAVSAAVLGTLLIGAGVTLFVLGLQRFQSFGQVTGTEVGGLVTTGVYRLSRNPQYTGWILILAGTAVTARSPLALGLVLAVVVAMRVWIPQEERHLEDEFGEEYIRYRQRVPRFLRLTPGRQTKR